MITPLKRGQLDDIFRFIKIRFGELNLEQVLEAFELFTARKLDFNDPKFGHYHDFNRLFIGTVLHAYKLHTYKNNKKPRIGSEPASKYPFDTPENQLIKLKHLIGTNNTNYDDIDFSKVFKYMEKTKVIDLSKLVKVQYVKKVLINLQQKIEEQRSKGLDTTGIELTISTPMFFVLECRKQYVLKHLKMDNV